MTENHSEWKFVKRSRSHRTDWI